MLTKKVIHIMKVTITVSEGALVEKKSCWMFFAFELGASVLKKVTKQAPGDMNLGKMLQLFRQLHCLSCGLDSWQVNLPVSNDSGVQRLILGSSILGYEYNIFL